MAKAIKTVTLTIDGSKVTVPESFNLIQAANRVGIDIPHYCYHPMLSIAGSCRLCFVEVEGAPKMVLGCDTKVKEDMVVRTNTPQVLDARNGMLEFLLINHPLDCPVCDRGGECMLQWYDMDHGPSHTRTIEPRRRFRKPEFDPLLDLERNRCVLCGRCVRFMEEIAGEHSVALFERGNRAYIGTFNNRSIDSIFSGMIIDYCPVGTWTNKPFRFRARVWELQQVQSTCPYCSSGCDLTLWMRAGEILRVTPPTTPQRVNFHLAYDGIAVICNQGRFGTEFAHGNPRIERPYAVRDGKRVALDWDRALEEAASRLRAVREEHGPESIGMIISSRATCEEMFLFQRLAREALGTNNVDWRVGLTSGEAAHAHSLALGQSTGDINNLEPYDVIVVINTDLPAQVPVAALKIKEAARRGVSDMYVLGYRLDPWLTRHAKATVLYSIEHAEKVIDGLARKSAVGLRSHIQRGYENMEHLIDRLRKADKGLIVFGLEDCDGLYADRLAWRIENLKNKLGAKWDLLPISAARNGIGAFMTGCQPDRRPGVWHDTAAEHWGGPWGATLPSRGLTAPEMIEAARRGELKALYVFGSDDFVPHPALDSLVEALKNLELLIVQDTFESPLTECADFVFPGAFFFEKGGTLLDVSGWPAEYTKGWKRPHEVQDDAVLLDVLAQKLGVDFGYKNVNDVFEDMMTTINPICPVKAGHLCAEGPGGETPIRCMNFPRAQARVQEGKFYAVGPNYLPTCRLTPGIHPQSIEPPEDEEPPVRHAEGELRLVWSPILRGRDHLGDRSSIMSSLREPGWVEMNAKDAERLGLREGDSVSVVGAGQASATGRLRVTENIAVGLVYAPSNWSEFSMSGRKAGLPVVEVKREEVSGEASA